MDVEGKANNAYCCWSNQLIYLSHSFLHSFSHKMFYQLGTCQICVTADS